MYKELSAACVAGYRSKNKAAARELISNPDTTPPAFFAAAHVLLGEGWCAWLQETVCHELRREGLEGHRDDLVGALQAVASTASSWWDYRAFCAVTQAFSGNPVTEHAFTPPHPENMAATVTEMTAVLGMALVSDDDDFTPEYSDEVAAYIAAALATAGFCCAPPQLDFCQDRLDRLVRQHTCKQAKKAEDASGVGDVPLSPEDVQAARLRDVTTYVEDRIKQATSELKKLASQP